jgi:hypothetical protein
MHGRGNWIRFPTEARDLSLLSRIQTGSEAHPASYPMDIGSPFSGGEGDHSPLSSAEATNGEAILPLLHTPSRRRA